MGSVGENYAAENICFGSIFRQQDTKRTKENHRVRKSVFMRIFMNLTKRLAGDRIDFRYSDRVSDMFLFRQHNRLEVAFEHASEILPVRREVCIIEVM